jgi:hypothetical protein
MLVKLTLGGLSRVDHTQGRPAKRVAALWQPSGQRHISATTRRSYQSDPATHRAGNDWKRRLPALERAALPATEWMGSDIRKKIAARASMAQLRDPKLVNCKSTVFVRN